MPEAVEPQNQSQIDDYLRRGASSLGPWTTHIWRDDPRHLAFLLARYKFVAKLFTGRGAVLEVGCGDAFGTAVVAQTVGSVHGVDFEPVVIEDARKRYEADGRTNVTFEVRDITTEPLPTRFDAAFSLDVIEHVPSADEDRFVDSIAESLHPDGIVVIGTPNKTADAYASEGSRLGHINLKTHDSLRVTVARRFTNVFSFSMNDEVVHTGYGPMAHYLLVLGVGVKAAG